MARPAKPHWPIDQLLDRTDLARLLDELATPAGSALRGRRWHCPIPHHADQHASVTMHVDGRGHERWRCWSGDETHRGDAIDLIQQTHRLDRAAAIAWLADRAGLQPDASPPTARSRPRPATVTAVPLDPIVVRYAHACARILWTNTGRPVRDWLHQRGLDEPILRANHIGADPGRHLLFRTRAMPQGATPGATFPALDPAGAITYVQTRYLQPDPPDIPRYDNPAARLGTNPRIGWTRALGEPRPGVLVVCEGLPDALTAAQAGHHAAGILGSQAPDLAVARQLTTHAGRHRLAIVAIADHDDAGHHWAARLTELVGQCGHPITVMQPPEPGLDLNAWAQRDASWTDHLPTATLSPAAQVDREPPGLATS